MYLFLPFCILEYQGVKSLLDIGIGPDGLSQIKKEKKKEKENDRNFL
jgi:hypothetical protein